MKGKFWGIGLLAALASVSMAVTPAFAQVEISPYAGGFFDPDFNGTKLKEEGIYGVRGSGYITNSLALEGVFSYLNHFEQDNVDPESRAILYDANLRHDFFLSGSSTWVPYVSAGVGGITAVLDSEFDPFVFEFQRRTVRLEDSDTFLTLNYGGGVKAMRVLGPVGLRFDIRLRTIPNYFGDGVHMLEPTGGLVFSFGDR